MDSLARIAQLDQFFVQQSFSLLANRYRIATLGSDGGEGEALAFVSQKRLKIREQVEFFADEQRKVPLLRLKANRILEVRARAEVQLPDGTVIGTVQKAFAKSILRSSWELLDPASQLVATAREASLFIALFRRFYGFIPVLGEVPLLIPFHFDISADGRSLGRYRRVFGLRDRYVMDLTNDPERRLDRRVAVAFAIALDALQDR